MGEPDEQDASRPQKAFLGVSGQRQSGETDTFK